MRNSTRSLFSSYCAHIAQLNAVDNVSHKFELQPEIEQKLEDRITESADFLNEINIIPVDEMKGQTLGLGVDSPIASRTNTKAAEREARSVGSMNEHSYECVQTNFDTYVEYKRLDMWAKFPDFQPRLRNHVTQQIARDRLMIGFNGESVSPDTDIDANPLLQDVNIGWLQGIRDHAPERVLSDIKVGAGGDYATLDGLVFDAAEELLDPWYKDDTDVVAITGRLLLSDKYLSLIEANDKPTEKNALQTLISNKLIGNRRANVVPFFPKKSILITKKSNLSIYWQNGSHRRSVIDNPKRDRIEDFNSVGEAYVIEDFGACAFIDNILTPTGAEGAWE
ncbi:phage major capsid protein, P2 family [Thalassospira marina]|uniref:Phage major capsid protein, P2 family n=1 Tax=Thalassospira marina TaxID=2048283 RepID=A0A2N3KX28_9PROT|nr:phage major capsid protein, P2 family [Thalassospira marina]PKR55043.1 phage major capsid protein, P2 family [Thalassospira marina]